MTDIVERAQPALEGVTDGPWTWTHGMDARAMVLGPDDLVVKLEGYADAEFIAQARGLVPGLVAEVERLREHAANLERLVRNPSVVAAIATVDPENAVEVEIR